jgi:ATP-dependent RNA helicase DeaD
MGLPEALNHTLLAMQFTQPTPIQEQAIPVALEGKDILGSAQTGTGKTGAFGIPLVARLMNDPDSAALVMTPTRELASQVIKQLQIMLGRQSKIKTALLIGGDSMGKQLQQLRCNPRLIVGTPGRINDHLQRKSLRLDKTNFLVLDETDRMLDMGFSVQIDAIMEHVSVQRQTLLFSATLPKNIVHIAKKYLNDPVRVAADAESSPAANIQQDVLRTSDSEKYNQLITELNEREGSVIVFVKTKHGADKMAVQLSKAGHEADAIHGDLRQNKRDRVIAAFRKQKYRILVATDVAARGLDIPHIEHVINYDLPQCPEDYIHRIGRTARAGAKGFALNFVTPADKAKWTAIDRLLNPDAYPAKGRAGGGNGNTRPQDKPKRKGGFVPAGKSRRAFGGKPPKKAA